MKKSHLLGAVCAFGFVGSANASLINITATSTNPNITDFTLQFDDTSGDGLLQIDEVVLFSGFTASGFGPTFDGSYDILEGTPNIPGISTVSGVAWGGNSLETNWNFIRSVSNIGGCCAATVWDYSSSVVPIPAAVWLFGSGLLGLIGMARHKKAA